MPLRMYYYLLGFLDKHAYCQHQETKFNGYSALYSNIGQSTTPSQGS